MHSDLQMVNTANSYIWSLSFPPQSYIFLQPLKLATLNLVH